MKQFLKFTFASCLGVFLASAVVFIFFSMFVGVVMSSYDSSGSKSQKIKSNSVFVLDLNRALPELTNNSANGGFNFDNPDLPSVHDLEYLITEAAEDENIKGIFINASNSQLGISNTALIRDAVVKFKESGKPVYAQSNFISQKGYLVAATADKLFLSETGGMDFRGFGAMLPFFKGTLDKLGVESNVFYAGDYKSATEPFRRTNMSDQNREQTRAYLNDSYNEYLEQISESRNISVSKLKSFANDLKTFDPETVLANGMVDELGYKDDAYDDMKLTLEMELDDKLNLVGIDTYFKTKGRLKIGTGSDKIAVVYAEGSITDGKAQAGVITADQYVRTLRKIEQSDKIKAVVLRVNSGGGSVIASDNIWKVMEDVKASGKPVVVSMGDLAASGGYYIACNADKIYAQPATITGSIGVFSMMFNTRALMEDKLGMTFDTVSTAKYASRLNGIYDFDANEDAFFQNMVDDYYQIFLKRVADGRDMSVADVHKIAQGRVWTGNKALELGLVDELGTLQNAIDYAAELAELESYKAVTYPQIKNQFEQLLEEFTQPDKAVKAAVGSAISSELNSKIPFYEHYSAFINNPKSAQAKLTIIPTY